MFFLLFTSNFVPLSHIIIDIILSMEQSQQLVQTITKGIQDKKGQDIIIADLRNIEGAIANYFVICQGSSPAQVEAISESIGNTVRTDLKEKPVNVAGLGLNHWVAIDYSDVLVHVFLPEERAFYDLETLWEDAKLLKIPNID